MFEFLKKIFSSKKEPDSGLPMEQQSMPVVSYDSETRKQNPSGVQNTSVTANAYPRNNTESQPFMTPSPQSSDGVDPVNRDVMDSLAAARESLRRLHEYNEQWEKDYKKMMDEFEKRHSSEELETQNLLEDYFKADLEGVILTDEFRQTFDLMETTLDNLIITGKAGTGKSTLLKYFLVHTRKSAVALAPTGIAAINIGGDTIHKFFRFPPHLLTPDDINIRPNKLYESIDTLIIDEFSMVDAWLFANLLYASKRIKRICIIGDEDVVTAFSC